MCVCSGQQAPRAWFHKFRSCFSQLGFLSSKSDPSLFLDRSSNAVVGLLVYVDDILITGSDSHLVALFDSSTQCLLCARRSWSHALLSGHRGCSLLGLYSSFSNEVHSQHPFQSQNDGWCSPMYHSNGSWRTAHPT